MYRPHHAALSPTQTTGCRKLHVSAANHLHCPDQAHAASSRIGQGRGAGFRPAHAPEDSSRVFTLKADCQSLQQLAKLSAGLFTSARGHAVRKLPPGLHGHRCPTSAGSLGDQGDELETLISTGSRRLQMSPLAGFVIFCSTGPCCC